MSQRTSRVDELLREEISEIISREVQDPRVGFVTVTGVDVTSDLRHATVWVSVIGDDQTRRDAMRALGRAMPFVRGKLGSLRIKRIPELHLVEDDSSERGTRLLKILDELETGGDPDVPQVGETLPTPAGRRSGEAAQERTDALSAERAERIARYKAAAARGERPRARSSNTSNRSPRRGG